MRFMGWNAKRPAEASRYVSSGRVRPSTFGKIPYRGPVSSPQPHILRLSRLGEVAQCLGELVAVRLGGHARLLVTLPFGEYAIGHVLPLGAHVVDLQDLAPYGRESVEVVDALITIVGLGIALYGRLVATVPGWFSKR